MTPYDHAVNSVNQWGGELEDYLMIHSWFDASQQSMSDYRHQAMRHHAEGILMCESAFGVTVALKSGRAIPTRWVAEQHIRSDFGRIPAFADWARAIRPEPWMGRGATSKVELSDQQLLDEPTDSTAH